jgi:superfamily I DNA and/or RNA helicase
MTSQTHHARHSKNGKLFFAGKGFTKAKAPKNIVKSSILPNEITIYVPSTEYDEQISHEEFEKRINDVRKELGKLFEGYTSVSATGGWVVGGKVIREPVVKVTAFFEPETYLGKKKQISTYLHKKRSEWKQQLLSVEYNNKLYLLGGKKYEPPTKQATITQFE